MAKAYSELSPFVSTKYAVPKHVERVLGNSFRAENVTYVPSILAPCEVSNGTGHANMPVRTGAASNEVSFGPSRNRGENKSMNAGGSPVKMTKRDESRKWMWWVLGSIAALQVYFVRELLAAFALFALGFLAIAGVVVSVYMLHRAWAVTVVRVAESRHPVMIAVRHGADVIEDIARRPFRRPGSAQPAN